MTPPSTSSGPTSVSPPGVVEVDLVVNETARRLERDQRYSARFHILLR